MNATELNQAELIFKQFGKDDWMGFQGSEKFDDGSEPLIAIAGDVVMILDNNGVGVFLPGDRSYYLTLVDSRKWVTTIAYVRGDDHILAALITSAQLYDWGFTATHIPADEQK